MQQRGFDYSFTDSCARLTLDFWCGVLFFWLKQNSIQQLWSLFQPIVKRPTDASEISSQTLTYVSVILGPLLFCALIGLIIFASMMKKQRSLHGTYSPQKQEINAPRIEMTEMLKIPPNERLI